MSVSMRIDAAQAVPLDEDVVVPESRNVRNRVLLDVDDRALRVALEQAFTAAGLEVRTVRNFKELAAWLILFGDSVTVVFQPPSVDALRKATLREIRRVGPNARLVAVLPMTSDAASDLDAAGVAQRFTLETPPMEIVEAVRTAG